MTNKDQNAAHQLGQSPGDAGRQQVSKCFACNDDICPKCRGHMSYGIDCLEATMNPDVDYCEGHDAK